MSTEDFHSRESFLNSVVTNRNLILAREQWINECQIFLCTISSDGSQKESVKNQSKILLEKLENLKND